MNRFAGLGRRLVEHFGRDLAVARIAPGSYSAGGIYAPGASSTFTIKAFVTKATGEQLERLPEGSRSTEAIAVFAFDTDLRAGRAAGGLPADRIAYRGEQWEVQLVDRWDDSGLVAAVAARATT